MSGRGLLYGLLGVLLVVCVFEAIVLIGAGFLHLHRMADDEIAWFETFEPYRVWDAGRHKAIDQRYLERIRGELMAARLDRAAAAARLARRRFRASGRAGDAELMSLGVEVGTRAADRLERNGRLSAAADWNDSVFVLAVRSEDERMRGAALGAFIEGLDLRTRDGKPCAALARVEWAKRGLGGEIPGFSAATQQELEARCARARRGGRGR